MVCMSKYFNFQLSHLFPQLGRHHYRGCGGRSRISGALPAGFKWLSNRYALNAHGVNSAHVCARSGLRAHIASIPVAPPRPSRRAILRTAAKRAKASQALGLSCLFFSGAVRKISKVCTAMRGKWLRFAHAWGASWGAPRLLRALARLLRFWDWCELGGSERFVLRSKVCSSAPYSAAVAKLPSHSANGHVGF